MDSLAGLLELTRWQDRRTDLPEIAKFKLFLYDQRKRKRQNYPHTIYLFFGNTIIRFKSFRVKFWAFKNVSKWVLQMLWRIENARIKER